MNCSENPAPAPGLVVLLNPASTAVEHQTVCHVFQAAGLAPVTFLSVHASALQVAAPGRCVPVRSMFGYRHLLKLRGILWPVLALQQTLRACPGPPRRCLVFDELFSSTMLQTALARRVVGTQVVVWCAENVAFTPLQRLISRAFARQVGAALCCCEETRQRARECGVGQTLFCPYPVEEPPQAAMRTVTQLRVVGYVGRLIPEKGVPELCQAAAALPELAFRFFGNGPLQHRITGGNLHYGGTFTSPAEMEQAYAGLDLLAVPSRTTSRWKEQYGRVAAEAMARGIPVIASDSGSLPEVVGDPQCLFREGDAEALTALLRRACALPAEAMAQWSRAARARFQAHLSPPAFGRAVAAAFTLAGRPPAARP